MKKEEKNQIIADLSKRILATPNFYITDISNLPSEATSKLRRLCHSKGIYLRVAKNTLIHKALEKSGTQYVKLGEVLKGSSAIMFCDTANVPAKVIREFRKTNEKPLLKGAFIDMDVFIGDANVSVLADLKSKNELIADVIYILQSPAKNVIGALQSGKNKLAGIVKTLSEKKEN